MSWSFTSSSWTLHTKILPCFWTWVMFLYSASLLHKLYGVLASILNSLPHQPSSLLYSKNLLFAQCRVSQEVCGITLLWKMVFSFILRIEEALLWQSYWIVTLDPCFCFNLKDTTCLCLSEALKMQTTKYFSHIGHFLRLVDDPKRFGHGAFVVFCWWAPFDLHPVMAFTCVKPACFTTYIPHLVHQRSLLCNVV